MKKYIHTICLSLNQYKFSKEYNEDESIFI